jgi:CRP/FNR family cyclic AMP-dependent transcriptional regulator
MGAWSVRWVILEGVDPEQQREVLARCARRRFRKGDTLFHEGDPGTTLHLLDKGRVAIRVTTPMGDAATLTVLGPGDVFGEQALLQPDGERTASAVALEAVETLTLAARDFADLRTRFPAVERILVTILAAQVRRLSQHLSEALYLPADKRVLRRLLELCGVYGTDGTSVPVVVPLTQDDLASMAGTTRPTANRVLQDAVDAGFVALGRARIEVLDRERLARRAR